MEAMRSTWTDNRLKEFRDRVELRFDGLDNRVERLSGRVDGLDARLDDMGRKMEAGFSRIDQDLREMRAEMAATNRMILQVGGGMIAAMLGGFLAVIATILATQL